MFKVNSFSFPTQPILTCFMLVLVVFSTTMRFVGTDENFDFVSTTDCSLASPNDTATHTTSHSENTDDKKQEKAPLTLKKASSSDALLQGFINTDFFQNILLPPSLEFVLPYFVTQKINSVPYFFSSSYFFKTLFRCIISPNAP